MKASPRPALNMCANINFIKFASLWHFGSPAFTSVNYFRPGLHTKDEKIMCACQTFALVLTARQRRQQRRQQRRRQRRRQRPQHQRTYKDISQREWPSLAILSMRQPDLTNHSCPTAPRLQTLPVDKSFNTAENSKTSRKTHKNIS